MPKPDDSAFLTIDSPEGPQQVRISSPTKPYFDCAAHLSKLDIANYFAAVAPGALLGIQGRPIVLKRFVNGACLSTGQPEPFYQKRAPSDLPPFLRTVTLSFPSGRTAEEVVVDNAPGMLWVVNLGCMELHPHPVLASDLDHPNELRVDLDPGPGIDWEDVRRVALVARDVLNAHNLTAFPKTSGSRGMHLNVPIHPRWSFTEVRRAALALAREVERRAPQLATSKWWKEERHGVFLDYNQNAKDRTTAAAYSVRPLPDARVSAPLHWDEVLTCNPADFTVLTMPARFASIGDPHSAMSTSAAGLESLLDLAARDEASGLGDAPWPPHFAKGEQEGKRVAPSRAKKFSDQIGEGFGEKRFRKRSSNSSEAVTKRSSNSSEAVTKRSSSGLQPAEKAPEGIGALAPEHATTDLSSRPESAPLAPTDLSSRPKSSQLHRDDVAESGVPGERSLLDGVQRPASGAATAASTKATKPARKPRTPKHPLLTISQSPDKSAAEFGLERWKQAHPEAATHLAPDDILIDRMRGASTIWYRIRVNLRNVPEALRPTQQTPDPDEDPTRAWREIKS